MSKFLALGTSLFGQNHAFLCQFQCWLFLIFIHLYICRFFSSHWTSLKIKRRSKGGVQSCWGSHGWTPTKMSETCGQLSSTKWSTGNTKVPESHKFDNVWLVSPCYWYFPIFLLHALVASHFNFVSFPSFSVPVFVAHRLSSLFPSFLRFFVFVTYTFHIVWTITSPEVLKEPWEKQGPSSNKLN